MKQSDLEKRLRLVRKQVYGKDSSAISLQSSDKLAEKSDVSYLYQDLLKIGLLSSLAIGTQIILFILSKNHLLNLNLF